MKSSWDNAALPLYNTRGGGTSTGCASVITTIGSASIS
jgi:hypothetical protein